MRVTTREQNLRLLLLHILLQNIESLRALFANYFSSMTYKLNIYDAIVSLFWNSMNNETGQCKDFVGPYFSAFQQIGITTSHDQAVVILANCLTAENYKLSN